MKALGDDHEALLAVDVAGAQHGVPGAVARRITIDRVGGHAALDQAGAHRRRFLATAAGDEIFYLARPPQRGRRIEAIDEVAVGPALGPDRCRAQHQRHLGDRYLRHVGE
jgi:hypothetical protein